MQLAGLFIYPVKSLRGHAPGAAAVEPRGLAGDRRWMIVDAGGRFITRREVPAMALLDVRPLADGLLLTHPELGECRVTLPGEDAPVIDAVVWRDTVPVRLGNDGADAFLTAALGRAARIVHQFDASRRPINPAYATPGEHVSLADGFPLLVTTTASLAALNERLGTAVTMTRFRPNLVIDGATAWAEDHWRRIRIGTVTLRIARPCSRCIIVTQDPLTGAREDGNEPLATLRTLGRAAKGGIMFGQNAIPETFGTVRPGNRIEVLEAGESNF